MNTFGSGLDVTLVRPEVVLIEEPIFVTGNILPHKTTNLTPAVSGLIEEVHVGVGDRVNKGDALLTIRQSDIKLQVERLGHSVTLASAELKNATKDLKTNRALHARRAVSEEVLDNMSTRKAVANAQLGIAKAQLSEAEQQLRDTVVIAPFDGVITNRSVDEGTYFSSMRGLASGAPLQIQKIDIVVASVFVPDRYLPKIKVGTKARVTIDTLNMTVESVIHIVNDRIDLPTRGIDVRIGVPNADYKIKTGLFCRVEIIPEPREALVVKSSAIMRADADYVFILDGVVAKRVAVETNKLESGATEILAGITSEDLVVVGPDLGRVTPGTDLSTKLIQRSASR